MLLRHYMTVLFWYRKNVRAVERPGTLYCRVTVDGVEHNFATSVRAFKAEWDAVRQQVRGRSDEAAVSNERLEQLKTGLREAFNILEREGTYITPARVIERYQKPQRRQLSLRELVAAYLPTLQARVTAGHLAASSCAAYVKYLERFDEWLVDTRRTELRPAEMTVRRAQQFFDWLLAKPRSRNYTVKVVGEVGALLKWAVRNEYIDTNPMADFKERTEPEKPVVFLTAAELVKLWYYDFASESLRKVADVFLFQCFTGLAYQDLANFRASEQLAPQPTGQLLLKLARHKTGTPILIPFFRPAVDLLAKYGGERLPVPSKVFMNRTLKQIAYLLDYKINVTTHVGRKTAGMVLLTDGVPMTIVSKWLGHKSVHITEKHYATVLSDTISNELSKVYGPAVVGIERTRPPFLREFTERLLAAA